VLRELRTIKKVVPESSTKSAYAFEAIPARHALERRNWREAAALQPRSTALPRAAALTYFARGYARARLRDVTGARADLAKLAEARSRLAVHSDEGANASSLVEVQRLGVAAWIALAEGQREEALRLMRSAADLEDLADDGPVTPGPLVRARELLGELLLELQQPRAALAAFEATLRTVPKRFNALYGVGRAKRALGDKAGAVAVRDGLNAVCAGRRCDPSRLAELADSKN
jgi:tetratricopeptide (TPR) repeat protein